MKEVKPGEVTSIGILHNKLNKEDVSKRIMEWLCAGEPIITKFVVHNTTKSAQVVISTVNSTMHIRVTDPEEDFRFHFKAKEQSANGTKEEKEQPPEESKTAEPGS
jgi:hypothetical protein